MRLCTSMMADILMAMRLLGISHHWVWGHRDGAGIGGVRIVKEETRERAQAADRRRPWTGWALMVTDPTGSILTIARSREELLESLPEPRDKTFWEMSWVRVED
jgi:hypothetical protein